MPYLTRQETLRALAALAVVTTSVTGCTRGSETAAATAAAPSSQAGCPAVLATAKTAVEQAEDVNAPGLARTAARKRLRARASSMSPKA